MLADPPGICDFLQKEICPYARMDKSNLSRAITKLERKNILFRFEHGIRFTKSFLKSVYGIE